MTSGNQIKIKLVRSKHGRLKAHQDCIRGLGLKRIGDTVVLKKDPCILGMIRKVSYLLEIEDGQSLCN